MIIIHNYSEFLFYPTFAMQIPRNFCKKRRAKIQLNHVKQDHFMHRTTALSCIKHTVCYANYIRCIVVYHVQKKYKKRFFVNTAKFFLSLALVSLFSSCQNLMAIETKAQQSPQEPTQITQDTQAISIEKEQSNRKKSSLPRKKNGIINIIMDAPHCPHPSIPVRKMTLAQLLDVYNYGKTHKIDLHLTSNVLERLIALSEDHAGVKIYKLEFADAHYQMNHLEIASIYYEDFATLYPSSKEAQYAAFKSIGCMFQLSLEADRDQTNTKKTIALAKEFIKEHPEHELKQEAQDILDNCYNRLLDHEIYVFNFYLKKKKFKPARMRIDFMTTTFDKLIPDLEARVAVVTKQLDAAMNPVKVDRKTTVYKFLG